MLGTRHPIWDPILSFLHTFSPKGTCIIINSVAAALLAWTKDSRGMSSTNFSSISSAAPASFAEEHTLSWV